MAKGTKYTSKGERNNVTQKILNKIQREQDTYIKATNIQTAWAKGQNPWVTIDNPNKENTKARKIKVKSNDLWGHPKEKKSFII